MAPLPAPLSGRALSCTLDAGLTAPAAARRLTECALRQWGVDDEDTLAVCAVVVSELATNGVLHGAAPATRVAVDVRLRGGVVQIGVTDDSEQLPWPAQADADHVSGRGLSIVEHVALRWGTESGEGGKRVFADVAVPVRPEAPQPVVSSEQLA